MSGYSRKRLEELGFLPPPMPLSTTKRTVTEPVPKCHLPFNGTLSEDEKRMLRQSAFEPVDEEEYGW